MASRFLASAQPASSLAWVVVCLIASIMAAQTNSPAPDPVLLDSKSASRMLLNEVKPEYPALAKVNYIQGAVRMQLQVTREGRVAEAHVVRGHPFLAEAALQAVRRWMYRPLKRGSQATEFSTFVDVRFALHGGKLVPGLGADARPGRREGADARLGALGGRAFSLRCGPPSGGAMDVQAGALGKSSRSVVSGRRRFRARLAGP